MKIKRTEQRLVACGVTQFFNENRDKWKKLNRGDVVEVSKEVYENELKDAFGDTIQVVTTSTPKNPTSTSVEDFVVTPVSDDGKGDN